MTRYTTDLAFVEYKDVKFDGKKLVLKSKKLEEALQGKRVFCKMKGTHYVLVGNDDYRAYINPFAGPTTELLKIPGVEYE